MVSLVKNQTVSLSKESSALSQLHFGLGWDPVKKKKVFLEDCLEATTQSISMLAAY